MKNIALWIVISCIIVGCSGTDFENLNIGSGGAITESFKQNSKGSQKLDILVITDNSKSMVAEQKELARKMDHFTNQLDQVDWRLAITTTDTSSGTYGLKGEFLSIEGEDGFVLTSQHKDFQKKFEKTIYRHETSNCGRDCPSDVEQPLTAALMSIQKANHETKSLFRQDANLAILIITDEDESGKRKTHSDELLFEFKKLWPYKTITVSAIAVVPNDQSCLSKSRGVYAWKVSEAVEQTQGIITSICNKDYSSNLRDIGENNRDNLLKSFVLKFEPQPKSVEVKTQPQIDYGKFVVTGKRVTFENPLPYNTQIHITYTVK